LSRPVSPRGFHSGPARAVAGGLALVATIVPVGALLVAAPASAAPSVTTYTPGPPSLATITNGTATAPWNTSQGDPGTTAYPYADLVPTYTPGGPTTTTGGATEPNVAVYPGAGSGTAGVAPYPSGVVGTPGPLDGYCGTGNTTAEDAGSPVRQPPGTTLPLAPAYFPHIVRNADGSLTGYFDYRPKDTDEAIVAATSTDNGRSWTYQGEALEQNPGYCPSADINDDGQGHPNVITVGGTSYLYTLQRPAGDNAGVGMLVHALTPTAANPLAGLPSAEPVGVDPDAFAQIAGPPLSVPVTGGTPTATITVNQTGQANSPEQLVPGPFVDLTQTPVPTASSIINCTAVGTTTLSGCTTTNPSGASVHNGDLIEQVIGTVGSNETIPKGPNNTVGSMGTKKNLPITFTNNLTATILNTNAPNRVYANGVAVYCPQSNASPTTALEFCTTGPKGSALTLSVGAPVTADPVVPATAEQTNGLVAPDGIVGVLPGYPGAPTGATVVMYTEKLLNYYLAGVTSASAGGTFSSTTGSSIQFYVQPTTSSSLPTPTVGSPVTVEMGDDTNSAVIPVTCTGLTIGSGSITSGSNPLIDTLTGCTVPSADNGGAYASNDQIGAPDAALESPATLAKTGEGSSNQDKLYKNNEDLTLLRVAYTTDGINFSTTGLDNNGIISGQSDGASPYSDINNPSSTTDPPSGLNQYATPGTTDATEMRWVGSAGSIITNPDGSDGLFLSGAWSADGDSDAFNQIFYSTSTDGEHWSEPVSVVSTDYTFSASVAQDNALAGGTDAALGISAYYSGRAYGPSVVQNPNGTLTMVFAGYRLPKPISSAGTVLGTNAAAPYTIGATDPALYRNILVETLSSSTAPAVATATSLGSTTTTPVVGQPVTYTATVAPVAPGAGIATGTVTFSGAAGTLCTEALDEEATDQATCTTTYVAPGSDAVTATYNGDSNYATSASTALDVSIGQDSTTTSVGAAPSAPVVGQPVTYTATVAVVAPGAGTPTGTVTVTGHAGTLCTGTLNGQSPDTAACTAADSAAGSDAVTATYNGDTNDQSSSSSPALAVPVSAAATSTAITTSDPAPVVGEVVTYTATVSATAPGAGTPTGSVTVTGASGTLCQGTLDQASPDTANCTTTYDAPGTDSVTAAYAGDGNYTTSTSGSQAETIAMADTTAALSASPTSPVVGQPVVYTATVAPVAPGAGTPTGAVTFTDASGTLCATTVNQSSPDTATCDTTYTQSQSDSITATYAGDDDFAGSQSPTLSESVTPAATSTAIKVDEANPVVGQTVTYTATVSVVAPGSGTPAGMVTFTHDGGTLCSVAMLDEDSPDQAVCTTNYPAVGGDSVTASYNGDSDDQPSSSGAVTVSIGPAATGTTLATTDASPVVGQPVTYTATVSATAPGSGTPTGTVTFTGAAGTLCTVSLNDMNPDQATCTTSDAHAGGDSVTASYAGDTNFTGSASTAQSETVTAASTTTSLAASTGSSVAGEDVTFTATVSVTAPGQGTPGGEVAFSDGGAPFCTTGLSDTTPDQAACTTSYPTTGSITVTATYEGTGDDTSSVSNQVTESVSAAQTTTTVGASAAPTVTGQTVTFTATVAPVAPSTGIPSGQVLFTVKNGVGKTLACSAGDTQSLSSGRATCTIAGTKLTPAVSPLSVSAAFEGTSSYQPSQTSVVHDIDQAATTVTVTSRHDPSVPGHAVVITATVRATSPGSGKVPGTVTFSFSPAGTLACTQGDAITLKASGKAVKCTLAKGSVTSAVTVTASYGGSSSYQAGNGSVEQNVS
jgi:hypothetical protein